MSSQNKLTIIPKSEWLELRDINLLNWPRHISAYYAVNNYIKWCKINSQIEKSITFYCVNGDWSDGTFFIVDGILLYLFTMSLSMGKLKIGLDLLNWSNGFILYGFQARLESAVKEIINNKKLIINVDHIMYTLYLSREKGSNLSVQPPPGVKIKKLSLKHADLANEIWPHKCNGSIDVVKNVIAMNISSAFFNENDELLGFMLRFQGPIGNLHINEKYRSKGLGKEVIKDVCKGLASVGEDTFCYVVKDNVISLKTLKKVGFVQTNDDIQFIITTPKARL